MGLLIAIPEQKHDIAILLVFGLYNHNTSISLKRQRWGPSSTLSAYGVTPDRGLGTCPTSFYALDLSVSKQDEYSKRSWLNKLKEVKKKKKGSVCEERRRGLGANPGWPWDEG